MDNYATYWDNLAARSGAMPAVTRWTPDQYRDFYRGIMGDLATRRVCQIADVGCGPALLVPLLREFWPDAKYTGYDVSAGMMAYAARFQPDADYVLIDGELVISPSPDLIICHSVFTHIFPEDTETYLRTFATSLAPGGLAHVSIHIDHDRGWTGNISRIDYAPAYFEQMATWVGLVVEGYTETAVPAGPVRYYRLVNP